MGYFWVTDHWLLLLPVVEPRRLTCIECGEDSTGNARGWRAYRCVGEDYGVYVAIFCPDCVEREFGEDERD